MNANNTQAILCVFVLGAVSALAAMAGPQPGAVQSPASESKKPAAPAIERVSPEKLHEDFRILRAALEEGHPGIYRYTPKAEIDLVEKRLKDLIKEKEGRQ